jgi:hypothetical protein
MSKLTTVIRQKILWWFRPPKDSFARTLANGSTVLDLEKVQKETSKLKELETDLKEFKLHQRRRRSSSRT